MTPEEMTDTFIEKLKSYIELGLPKNVSEITAAADVVRIWKGDVSDPFQLDRDTRIVMAVVDAFIWRKN